MAGSEAAVEDMRKREEELESLPDECRALLPVFLELNSTRMPGMSLGPITHQELGWYLLESGVRLTWVEVRWIMMAAGGFMRGVHRDGPAPQATVETEAESAEPPALT